jgi:hypothetical protein
MKRTMWAAVAAAVAVAVAVVLIAGKDDIRRFRRIRAM